MSGYFKNEAEKNAALRRARVRVFAILVITAILFLFMIYQTFIK